MTVAVIVTINLYLNCPKQIQKIRNSKVHSYNISTQKNCIKLKYIKKYAKKHGLDKTAEKMYWPKVSPASSPAAFSSSLIVVCALVHSTHVAISDPVMPRCPEAFYGTARPNKTSLSGTIWCLQKSAINIVILIADSNNYWGRSTVLSIE